MPCDTGGLPACIYMRTHGYSPGEHEHPDDLRAWDIYWKMQRIGFEAVYRLRRMEQLDDYAADWLLIRLVLLSDKVQVQQQMREPQ